MKFIDCFEENEDLKEEDSMKLNDIFDSIKIGDTVTVKRPKFRNSKEEDWTPPMSDKGNVCFVHPEKRFITLEFKTLFGRYCESFFKREIISVSNE